MQKKTTTSIIFGFLLFICVSIFFLSQIPLFQGINGIVSFITIPVQKMTFHLSHTTDTSEVATLQKENQLLAKKLVDQKKLIDENNALKDQFRVNNPSNAVLLPATVIGAPGFFPGASKPEELIVSVGSKDGVRVGQAVVVNGNLIGVIQRVSYALAVVTPLDFIHHSFTAKTVETNATGIVVSDTDGIRLDNVLLADTLKKDDIVMTKGDINEKGEGILPTIVVGKIVNVDKKSSNLFQSAKLVSLIDIAKVSSVFVVISQ